MTLQSDHLPWKVSLEYDLDSSMFALSINDFPFLDLPYLDNIITAGSQSINMGSIAINGKQIHNGLIQYAGITFEQMRQKCNITQPTSEVILSRLECSSSEVLHSVLDDIGRSIDDEQGLRRLEIEEFYDSNKLDGWPLSQLVAKCHNLKHLTINELYTTEESCSALVRFVGQVCKYSQCLQTLYLYRTFSSVEDGAKLLKTLAADGISTIRRLTISREFNWFKDGRDDCIESLLIILSR